MKKLSLTLLIALALSMLTNAYFLGRSLGIHDEPLKSISVMHDEQNNVILISSYYRGLLTDKILHGPQITLDADTLTTMQMELFRDGVRIQRIGID